MSAIVLAAIDAELALLTQLVPEPDGELGYGSDLWCESDIDPTGLMIPGDSKLQLAQAAFHYVTTRRGDIPDAPELGRDVRSLLSKGLTQAQLRAEASQYANEILKDDRFAGAEIEFVQTLNAKALALTIHLEPDDDSIGQFDLLIRVEATGAWIEAVT